MLADQSIGLLTPLYSSRVRPVRQEKKLGSMTSAMVVRVATGDDVEALADVHLSSARYHAALDAGFYTVPDRDAVVRDLKKVLEPAEDSSVVRLVAELDGAVVGTANVELRSPSDSSMLRQQVAASVGVAVLEDRRGSGVGSLLMEAAEEWARERGASLMMLDASAANVEARRFYEERHGYRLRGVLMTKQIDAGTEIR